MTHSAHNNGRIVYKYFNSDSLAIEPLALIIGRHVEIVGDACARTKNRFGLLCARGEMNQFRDI